MHWMWHTSFFFSVRSPHFYGLAISSQCEKVLYARILTHSVTPNTECGRLSITGGRSCNRPINHFMSTFLVYTLRGCRLCLSFTGLHDASTLPRIEVLFEIPFLPSAQHGNIGSNTTISRAEWLGMRLAWLGYAHLLLCHSRWYCDLLFISVAYRRMDNFH